VLRTQTSDLDASTATRADDAPVPGATLVAEAPTADAALAEVHATYGAEARIIAAKRVLRGGIGGFFAREVVQIHAAAPAESHASAAGADADADADSIATAEVAEGIASPIDRLLADVGDVPDEVDFATFLRRQLAPETDAAASMSSAAALTAGGLPAAASTPAPVRWPAASDLDRPAWADAPAGTHTTPGEAVVHLPAEATVDRSTDRLANDEPAVDTETFVPTPTGLLPAPTASTPTPPDGRAWSRTTLIRIGLPAAFVQSLDVPERADDVAWTFALAEALRPLCRPLPAGQALLIGPRARGLATAVDVPVTNVGQPVVAIGDVAAAVTGSATSLQWLKRERHGRWLHLVIGGKRWRDLLHQDPLAVSWASEEHLPEALRAAAELGLVLGYGPLGGTIGRARPLDVALAVRDLVPVR